MTVYSGALSNNIYTAVPFTQVSIAYSALTSSYQLIGGALFAAPMVIIVIVSTLNDSVQWSWDGVNAAFPVIADATIIIDLKSDKIVLPAKYGPYVKTLGSPTSGSLYVGGFIGGVAL
jgi:Flp pilus assembly pilin Flp